MLVLGGLDFRIKIVSWASLVLHQQNSSELYMVAHHLEVRSQRVNLAETQELQIWVTPIIAVLALR
jgi:hypothetical protein